MTANNPVKATDSNIISLKNLRWCDTDGYYFDPLTDQVYSSIAPKHSVDNLFPLTAEISTNGSKSFKLRGIRFSVSEIHDDLANNANTKIRGAYKTIMASKGTPSEPVQTSEKWVKVTDWRTLKIGDIIKTDDPDFNRSQSYIITYVEPPSFSGKCAIKVSVLHPQTQVEWVDVRHPLYQLESPKTSKGWVILEMKAAQNTLIAIQQRFDSTILQSESDADAKLKQLCDESPNTAFVKLEIKNFAITKTNPEFQLT